MSVLRVMLAVLVALVATSQATVAQSAPDSLAADTATVENPALRQELLEMAAKDQAARKALIEKQKAGLPLGLKDVQEVMAIDSIHTVRMKAIVAEQGWPDASMVGEDGADAAFLIVQHADRDPVFQRTMVPLLRAAYERGEATGQHVALLTDRVRVAQGEPQRYGTQTRIQDGNVVFLPIEDSSSVDQRRAKMGLPPLDEYAQALREAYGIESGGSSNESTTH